VRTSANPNGLSGHDPEGSSAADEDDGFFMTKAAALLATLSFGLTDVAAVSGSVGTVNVPASASAPAESAPEKPASFLPKRAKADKDPSCAEVVQAQYMNCGQYLDKEKKKRCTDGAAEFCRLKDEFFAPELGECAADCIWSDARLKNGESLDAEYMEKGHPMNAVMDLEVKLQIHADLDAAEEMKFMTKCMHDCWDRKFGR